MNARVFPEVWAEIQPKIEGLPLVAHNSPFDEGCLKSVFQMYRMDYPDYEFHCTCRASGRKLGSLLTNHQLQTVAAYCGYDLTQHHNALADAEACAWIAEKTTIILTTHFNVFCHKMTIALQRELLSRVHTVKHSFGLVHLSLSNKNVYGENNSIYFQ